MLAVLMPRVPLVRSMAALAPAKVMVVELIVVAPVPVANVLLPVTAVLPARLMPFEPLLIVTPVVPVELPMLIAFEFAPLPRFTSPVVPESRVKIPVVPVVTFNADAGADESASVLFDVTVVAPVPVNVAAPAATVKRVPPLVCKFKTFASVVPSERAPPMLFPESHAKEPVDKHVELSSKMFPVRFGKVHVFPLPVKSADVIVPVKEAALPVCGTMASLSFVAVGVWNVDVRASTSKLPEPVAMFTAVDPVVFPMLMIFELAPLPRFTAPVVPESSVSAVVVGVTIVPPFVVRLPVKTPLPEVSSASAVTPFVSMFSAFASVVPSVAVPPKALPPLRNA